FGCLLNATIRYQSFDTRGQIFFRQFMTRNRFDTRAQIMYPTSPERLVAHMGDNHGWSARAQSGCGCPRPTMMHYRRHALEQPAMRYGIQQVNLLWIIPQGLRFIPAAHHNATLTGLPECPADQVNQRLRIAPGHTAK